MSRAIGLFAIGLVLSAGCTNKSETTTETAASGHHASGTGASHDAHNSHSAHAHSAEPTSSAGLVAITNGKVELNPSNTRIGWVGTHAGDDPNPRVGTFEKFAGVAEVDPAAKTLKSVSVEIETASLKSPIDNLTAHLNSPDFFDTREYPTATFKSTNIAEDGTVTGDLTLHGVTKEISFPAAITVTDAGIAVKTEFTIDRTDFKIGEGQDRVEKEVQINVTVGDQDPPETVGEQSGEGGDASSDDGSPSTEGNTANP